MPTRLLTWFWTFSPQICLCHLISRRTERFDPRNFKEGRRTKRNTLNRWFGKAFSDQLGDLPSHLKRWWAGAERRSVNFLSYYWRNIKIYEKDLHSTHLPANEAWFVKVVVNQEQGGQIIGLLQRSKFGCHAEIDQLVKPRWCQTVCLPFVWSRLELNLSGWDLFFIWIIRGHNTGPRSPRTSQVKSCVLIGLLKTLQTFLSVVGIINQNFLFIAKWSAIIWDRLPIGLWSINLLHGASIDLAFPLWCLPDPQLSFFMFKSKSLRVNFHHHLRKKYIPHILGVLCMLLWSFHPL